MSDATQTLEFAVSVDGDHFLPMATEAECHLWAKDAIDVGVKPGESAKYYIGKRVHPMEALRCGFAKEEEDRMLHLGNWLLEEFNFRICDSTGPFGPEKPLHLSREDKINFGRGAFNRLTAIAEVREMCVVDVETYTYQSEG